MSGRLDVSVVVPTHNRASRLSAALEALARQDWPPQSIEAIVVADGCTDDTAAVFAAWRPPFTARLIETPPGGPAVARNRGAAEARGRCLIFLDDDIQAAPGLVRAHMEAHETSAGQIVIGYLPAQVNGTDFFSIALRGWWDAMFQEMWKPGHRFTFRDLLSGNFSLERQRFESSGGFQTKLRCHEDYELGLRLIEAGATLRFEPRALGLHAERTDLNASLKRKFEEGRADVWLLARYPHLLDVLPVRYIEVTSMRRRMLRRLAGGPSWLRLAVVRVLRGRLRVYEHVRLRYRWRALLEDLLFFEYWRGVVDAAGGPPDLVAMEKRAAPDRAPAIVEIDLADGVDAAERRLDRERPASVRLRYGQWMIGDVPAVPGAENLRGEHLRPLLAERLVEPYLRALALAGELPPVVDAARVLSAYPPPRVSSMPPREARLTA